MSLKSVILDGKKVMVAGFVSTGEIDSTVETINSSWPCCKGKTNFRKNISALVVSAPTLETAKDIAETLEILFFPITA